MGINSRIIGGINNEKNHYRGHYRGRPKLKKDIVYVIRKELEAVSRYGQFRLRGINYKIEMQETEDAINLSISVPINQFPLEDIEEEGGDVE